ILNSIHCCYRHYLTLYLTFAHYFFFFFFQAEDGIRDRNVTGVQTCALPILKIHEDLQKIMTIDDGWVYKDVFRALGYGTVFILYWIVDGLENSVDKIITLNGFYDAYFVGELID